MSILFWVLLSFTVVSALIAWLGFRGGDTLKEEEGQLNQEQALEREKLQMLSSEAELYVVK